MPTPTPKTFMLISPRERADLPVWSWKPGENGVVGEHLNSVNQMLRIAQPFHELNQAIADHEEKMKTGLPQPELILPVPEVRRQKALQAKAQLRQIKEQTAARYIKSETELGSLKPFDYTNADPVEGREWREHSLKLDHTARLELVAKNANFRRAVLQRDPELSGFLESDWQALYDAQMEVTHGPRLVALGGEIEAGKRALALAEKVERQIGNELIAVGEKPPEPDNKQPPPEPWNLVIDAD